MSEQSAPVPRTAASSDEYFTAGRLKVIGSITAAVVLVGALGGMAGIAFDSEVPRPGSPEAPAAEPPATGGGASKLLTGARTPAEAVAALAAPKVRGRFVNLANKVAFFLPNGWTIDYQEGTQAALSSGKGSYSFVLSGKVARTATAGNLIASNIAGLLPKQNYTQLKTTKVRPWAGAFGSVLSSAVIDYTAMWVDNQGSAPIYGQIYAVVRQDGTALIILVEHIPPQDWDKTAAPRSAIVTNSVGRFAGLF